MEMLQSLGTVRNTPYKHTYSNSFFNEWDAVKLLDYLERARIWKYVLKPGFLELHNTDLRQCDLPSDVEYIVRKPFLDRLGQLVETEFSTCLSGEVDVHSHRMTAGQSIGAHTDYGETDQNYRLVVQLNKGWSTDNGGFLFLLRANEQPRSGDDFLCYAPIHNTLVAFEITDRSWHAVSPVIAGARYTITFSFRRSRYGMAQTS